VATDALGDDARIATVSGVELLPTLAAVATSSINGLIKWADAYGRKLPRLSVACADLESFDLADVDVVYMASTVFEDALVERFAQRAAATLRPGSRVVTLASPLKHDAFRVDRVVQCTNSWGAEEAYVNVRRTESERCGGL
jgi:hypothetical protein